MAAMDRETGKEIEGVAEVEQSLDTILETPLGSRVMRADYGSDLLKMTDVGMNASGRARLAQATHKTVRRHEPRARITVARYDVDATGVVVQTIEGEVIVTREPITLRRRG